MENTQFLNAELIAQAIAKITENDVYECRIISNNKRNPLSGFFFGTESLLPALQNTVDLRNTNVYITLQACNEAVYSRAQKDHFLANQPATSDNDITGYRWLFIAMDPERVTGVSSTDAELLESAKLASRVYKYMRDLGFSEPLKAVSGNGCHLLYKINISNKPENVQLLQRCLETLALLFNNDKVKIDTVNFNPSRVCKLYGTLAQKGSSTEERPFRMSYIKNPDADIQVNEKIYLEKLAAQYPVIEQPEPAKYNNYQPESFDVERFMNDHGIQYTAKPYKGGVKYVLKECPFDHQHTAPDSAIFKLSSGALGFRCLHNSCADKTWQDVRKLFEPDAYERKSAEYDQHIELGLAQHNRMKQQQLQAMQNPNVEDGQPMYYTMADVYELDEPEHEYIRTGIKELDEKMIGLQKAAVSVVSGLRGAAKSTMLSQVMLNAVNDGHTVVCYSGELTAKNFWTWISKQAAGPQNMVDSRKYSGKWTVDSKYIQPIINWFGDKLWLYNNNYGNDFAKLAEDLLKACNDHKADLLVIDNMMALSLSGFDSDKYEAQKKFVWRLKYIAKVCNVHVVFVAHPRKAIDFLRLEDIAGTGDIANTVDNAFIVHRVNNDFVRKTQQMFKWPKDDKRYEADNIIEIAKDRENGTQDFFIQLWYDAKSKRLLNEKGENKKYGWECNCQPEEEDNPF